MLLRGLVAVALAYLLGSLPTGALVGRLYGVDLRQRGSGSTGATNTLRVLGKGAGASVLAGDALKGYLAVALARRLSACSWAPPLAGLAAIVGHSYSLFLGLRGGKGVATGLGSLLALSPAALLAGAATALPTIAATRYVSLGSLVGTTTGAAALLAQVLRGSAPRADAAYALGAAGLIWFAHRDNLGRLRQGTERKLGERA